MNRAAWLGLLAACGAPTNVAPDLGGPWRDAEEVPPSASSALEERVLDGPPEPLPSTLPPDADVVVREVRPRPGAVPKVLALDRFRPRDVAVSPDGQRLAFLRDRPAVLDVATGEVVAELPEGEGCSHPEWSGDGRTIALWCPRAPTARAVLRLDRHAFRLVLWTPDDGRRRDIDGFRGDPASTTWVPTRGAWWGTGSDGDVLGSWVEPDGDVVDEPVPDGAPLGAPRWVAWSPDGASGVLTLRGKGTDAPARAVPLAWVGDRLVAAPAVEVATGAEPRLDVAADGRWWGTGRHGADLLFLPDGTQAWTSEPPRTSSGERARPWPPGGRVDEVWKAVFLATGRCPASPPAWSQNAAERAASPDGRFTAHGLWIEDPRDFSRAWLPVASSVSRVVVHGEVGPGLWLVTLDHVPHLLDAVAGRMRWALDRSIVLASDGSNVLLRHGDDLLRVDLDAGHAWHLPVADARAAGGAVWARDPAGTLRRVLPDGRVTHRVDVPFAAPSTEDSATRDGWRAWSFGRGLVAVYEAAPDRVHRLPPDVAWFGFFENGPTCGFGSPPALGWLADDGVHLLDDRGHEHRLRWADAAVGVDLAPAAAPTSAQVGGWIAATVRSDLEVWASADTEGVTLRLFPGDPPSTELRWPALHPDAPSPARVEVAPPPLELHALPHGGWVLRREDGSVVGHDPVGAVVLDDPRLAVRPPAMRVRPSPWRVPATPALGPCPWDR